MVKSFMMRRVIDSLTAEYFQERKGYVVENDFFVGRQVDSIVDASPVSVGVRMCTSPR